MTPSIPTNMLAVQFAAPGAEPVAREAPVPRPGPGEVLIRMAASPINPSDINFISGGYDVQRSYPLIPGYEGSGTVVAAGPGILPRFLMGRRVAAAASPPSGGAWAEYMVTAAARCFPLGKRVSFEQGAMSLVNPMTALAFIEIAGRDKHKAIVSTAAASALGKMILRLARQPRIEVINIVRRPDQADLLRKLGAAHVLDSTDARFQDQLRSLAQRLNATLVLDAVGGELTLLLIEAAPPGSTIIVYGNLSKETSHVDPRLLLLGNKRLEGFYLPNWMAKQGLLTKLRDMRTVQRLAGDALGSTIQRRFPLSEVRNALEAYGRSKTLGKILLVADPHAVHID